MVFGRSAARKGQQNHHGLLAFPSLHACFYHMALRILTVYIVILLVFFFQTVCGRVCHALANLRPDPLRSSPNMRVPWRPPRGQSRLPDATKPVMAIIRHHKQNQPDVTRFYSHYIPTIFPLFPLHNRHYTCASSVSDSLSRFRHRSFLEGSARGAPVLPPCVRHMC